MTDYGHIISEILTDPLHGDGYQFWSGIGIPGVVGSHVLVTLRKHNCHKKGCPRMARHNRDYCRHHAIPDGDLRASRVR